MNGFEFRQRGREMVDYMVDYLENIDARSGQRHSINLKYNIPLICNYLQAGDSEYWTWISAGIVAQQEKESGYEPQKNSICN